jgi:2-succinyl-5-enolpyruvyl-6-hydroxy-3-cyclohexene-1-carboxylate synthase
MPARSGIPSGWNRLGRLVSSTFLESSRLAGRAARPLVKQLIKTAAKAAVKPVLEQVMQPMINRVTQVIQQAQGRPLPRLRRQRCLQLSECDVEKPIEESGQDTGRRAGSGRSVVLCEGNEHEEGTTHCAKVGDYTTRHMLEDMQKDTDGHIDWIEKQLELIKQVGLEQYLSEQIHEEKS